MQSTVAFFTYSHGIGYLLTAMVFVWLAFWFGFRWRCRTVAMMMHSGLCVFAARSTVALACLALGVSFLWAMYLSVASIGEDDDVGAAPLTQTVQIAQAQQVADWNYPGNTAH